MNSRPLIYVICLFFMITMAVGVLSPQEAEKIFEETIVVLEEVENEAEVIKVEEKVMTVLAETPSLYPVVRVIDGDTIVINNKDENETVRMIGVDTPETVHPSKPVGCFGKEASAKTKEWLEGREVSLEFDDTEGKLDKYYRTLAYVRRDDGFFINQELIAEGYAYEYTYNLPYRYQASFIEAERVAKENGRGLWGESSNCVI